MTPLHHLKRSLGTLLALGLILLVSLFVVRSLAGLGTQPAASPPENAGQATTVAGATNTPQGQDGAKPATPTPTPTDLGQAETTATGKRPPACTFPLADIKPVESQPETYTFSEPKVVLTAPEGNIYHIAEWLPDNQQILMTEEIGNEPNRIESITLYNPVTGDAKVYAIRPVTYQSPAWQSELNAVVYPVMRYFDINKQNHTYKFSRELWVSYGDAGTSKKLSDNLSQLPFVIQPNGSDMLYLSDKKISKLDKSLSKSLTTSVDFIQLDYAKERRNDKSVSYNMAWQSGTSLIFLYSEGAMQGGGYTFILNAETGNVCELNLGGWAKVARWSSDGRYLAFIRIKEYTFLYPRSELALLDTTTGELAALNVTLDEIMEQYYVKDFTWAPDNHHLLTINEVYISSNNQSETGLYLVDILSSHSIRVVPEYKGFVFSQDSGFAWSSDGSKVALHCPTQTKDQICLISVYTSGQ